jgi:ketosteroid isomerase-like protein
MFVVLPGVAFAHVTVTPREARPGVEQQYMVRVPTEGQVVTTSVYLEVPDGVMITDVPRPEGAMHEMKQDGNRITAIIWTKEIPPKQRAEFVFKATNPAAEGQITWNVQQRFADGKSSHWTPGTKLTKTPASPAPPPAATAASRTARHGAVGQQAAATGEAAVIEKWLAEYDAAFNAKDLQKLGTFYHPEVTIYEGGGIDNGWAAYRDGHLGPELKAFENLQFGHSNRQIHVLGDGRTAYAISTYSLKAKMGERNIDSGGLETLVLVKDADGDWKIRHSHTSSRPRRPAQ